MTDSSTPLFAHLEATAGIVTARLVGPNFGEREGEIVHGMLEAQLASAEARALVLDFDEIKFVNSAGLGACVRIQSLGRGRNVKVVLYRLNRQLHDVFKMSRLDKLFTIAPDEKKLAKALK